METFSSFAVEVFFSETGTACVRVKAEMKNSNVERNAF